LEKHSVDEIAKPASPSSKKQQVITHLLHQRLSSRENTVTSPKTKNKAFYIKRPLYSPSSAERLAIQNSIGSRHSPQHIIQMSSSQTKQLNPDDYKISPFKNHKKIVETPKKQPLMISISKDNDSMKSMYENLKLHFENSNQELLKQQHTTKEISIGELVDSIQQRDTPQQNATCDSKISILLEPEDQSEQKIRVKIGTYD
jgi:hypothetical protein